MRGPRRLIVVLLIAAVLIFGAPILITLVREGGQPVDAPMVTPRPATITPDVT